jgi:hypothetical protein
MKLSKMKQGREATGTKSLEQYKQDKPTQLNFFEHDEYSNTIEHYDFIPLHVWGKPDRVNGQYLKTIKREYEYKGVKYEVEIEPARIKDKKGVEKEYYPGQREELVEDALRKLVCEGQGMFLDGQAAVKFTVYQLQQELKSKGHSYSRKQIKDALSICTKAKIIMTLDDGDKVISGKLAVLGLREHDQWANKTQKFSYAVFHPLVTRGIKNGTFRLINYDKTMTYRSVIARQLHKRMSHHFTQASIANSYNILLTTIIRDFGLTPYKQLRDNLRDVLAALEEMKEKEVISFYEVEKMFDTRRRNKMVDAKLTLFPDRHFTSEVIQANKQQKLLASPRQ